MNSEQAVNPSARRPFAADTRSTERGYTLSLQGIWHRIVLAAIVGLAAVLDCAGLSREGYSNAF